MIGVDGGVCVVDTLWGQVNLGFEWTTMKPQTNPQVVIS